MNVADIVATVLAALAAVGAGALVVKGIFALIDGQSDATRYGAIESAGSVLRGGMWIGILERLAVFASVLAGWPDGIALVLGVKGLARYPELRANTTGVAERFIIGTFASVLWAAACAGAAMWVMR